MLQRHAVQKVEWKSNTVIQHFCVYVCVGNTVEFIIAGGRVHNRETGNLIFDCKLWQGNRYNRKRKTHEVYLLEFTVYCLRCSKLIRFNYGYFWSSRLYVNITMSHIYDQLCNEWVYEWVSTNFSQELVVSLINVYKKCLIVYFHVFPSSCLNLCSNSC